MRAVLRVRVRQRHPPSVIVPALSPFPFVASTLELALFEAQCAYADRHGLLPEDVRVVVFEDVSQPPPPPPEPPPFPTAS